MTNSDSNSKDLDEVSIKLMARIKQMKVEKGQEVDKCSNNDKNSSGFNYNLNSPLCISPLSTQKVNLETVNEHEELFHEKIMKQRRTNSCFGNNGKNIENERKSFAEFFGKQKEKELELLNNFKVNFKFNCLDPSFKTERDAEERNSY